MCTVSCFSAPRSEYGNDTGRMGESAYKKYEIALYTMHDHGVCFMGAHVEACREIENPNWSADEHCCSTDSPCSLGNGGCALDGDCEVRDAAASALKDRLEISCDRN